MITEKKIEITKVNKLDFDYRLCEPYELDISDDELETDVEAELIRKITHAELVSLMISDYVAPARMLEELAWTGKYASVYLTAKTQAVADQFKGINIIDTTIDPSLSYNYINIIDGMGVKSCYSLDGPCRVGDLIEFPRSTSSIRLNYDCLLGIDRVLIVGSGDSFNDFIYGYCMDNNLPMVYVADAKNFNESVYDTAVKYNLDLSVAVGTNSGIYCTRGDYLFRVICINNILTRIPVGDVKKDRSLPLYRNLMLKGSKRGPSEGAYVVSNGDIIKLDIQDTNTVEISVDAATMEDYIEEKFDSSAANGNDASAKVTKYIYTLNPPRFNSGDYKDSNIYHGFLESVNAAAGCYDSACMCSALEEIDEFDTNGRFGIIAADMRKCREDCCANLFNFDSISSGKKNLGKDASNLALSFSFLETHMREACVDLMSEGAQQKISVLNDQISRNQEVIKKLEDDIAKNPSAFLNKNRVTAKKEENQKLIEQRDKYAEESGKHTDAEIDAFLANCRKQGNGFRSAVMGRSEGTGKSKVDHFSTFLNEYYDNMVKFIPEFIEKIQLAAEEDFPLDYMVYDHDGKRYIVINSLDEYESTKNIREKYGLACVAGPAEET